MLVCFSLDVYLGVWYFDVALVSRSTGDNLISYHLGATHMPYLISEMHSGGFLFYICIKRNLDHRNSQTTAFQLCAYEHQTWQKVFMTYVFVTRNWKSSV